jgi:hypothetical protein
MVGYGDVTKPGSVVMTIAIVLACGGEHAAVMDAPGTSGDETAASSSSTNALTTTDHHEDSGSDTTDDGGEPVDPEPPTFPLTGPTIWTTQDMLQRAWVGIERDEAPFIEAWARVQAAADDLLDATLEPYQGEEYLHFYRTARDQGQALRHLAIAHHLSGEAVYLDAARSLLLAWVDDGDENTSPASELPHSAGLVIGRTMSIFADGYALLHYSLSDHERARVENWLSAKVPIIHESRDIWVSGTYENFQPPYLNEQFFNNHLGAQTMGLLAIGYATGDESLVHEELRGAANPRDFETLLEGVILMPGDALYKGDPSLTGNAPPVQAGEIYDRYRISGGSGLHYAHLHLRLLTLMALMADNNDDADYFDHVTEGGEHLLVSFQFYGAFAVEGRSDARTGYYEGSPVDWDMLGLYELAQRYYPEEVEILEPLELRPRVRRDRETFGWTAPLLFASGDVSQRVGRWEFERPGRAEGWIARKSVTLSVDGGALQVALAGDDPGMLSPEQLDLSTAEYGTLRLGVRNQAIDGNLQVFFTTEDEPAFSAERHIAVALPPAGGPQAEVVVELGAHPLWTGTLRQLRIDPYDGTTTGDVVFDYIRLEP